MDPEQIDSALDEANQLLEAGKAAESLRRLDELEDQLVDSDDRIECCSLQAYALSELGRPSEALGVLEPLLAEFPESARLLGTLGVVLSGNSHLEQAREVLETAVALDEEDATLVANLALVYEKLHDFRTAVSLYDRAIDRGADLDWALQRKAFALTEAGDHDAAKATLKRYLSLVPEDTEQWIALAILQSDSQQYAEAYACYSRAEQIDPDAAALRLNWGVTAVRAGDVELAGEQLAHLERVAPNSVRGLLLRAFILEEQDEGKAAQRCYADALQRVDPEDHGELSYALEMAMDFYARRGMRPKCEELLQRAYAGNACTVELCEPYRELTGAELARGYWFSLIVEADYREGLYAVYDDAEEAGSVARYQRSFQVIARDHDEAVELVLDFARRLGESEVVVREFVREEPLENVFSGIYEVEKESLVLGSA